MLIGLGGGAASSMASGQSSSDLDFASVQRDNAEMQRRCQEVIDACAALGDANPIRLHSRRRRGRLVERVAGTCEGRRRAAAVSSCAAYPAPTLDSRRTKSGATRRRSVTCSRSRSTTCRRSNASAVASGVRIAVVGDATAEPRLVVEDETFAQPSGRSADGRAVRQSAEAAARVRAAGDAGRRRSTRPALRSHDALDRVLRFPAVGSKQFLITIGDRSITGFVVRDQMVGPWQVPVADAAVTTLGFKTLQGEAMAMGERSPLALIDPAASARMAVGEALTNLASVGGRRTRPGRVVGELDGGGRTRQRGSGAVRRGCSGRAGVVSGARHRDSGRQRQPVDAHAVARRGAANIR